jgi:hypothetical protein
MSKARARDLLFVELSKFPRQRRLHFFFVSCSNLCKLPLIRSIDNRMWRAVLILSACQLASAFVPLIDGGKGMPKLYDAYFNEQIAKQASTAVARAIGAGKVSRLYCFVCSLSGYSLLWM